MSSITVIIIPITITIQRFSGGIDGSEASTSDQKREHDKSPPSTVVPRARASIVPSVPVVHFLSTSRYNRYTTIKFPCSPYSSGDTITAPKWYDCTIPRDNLRQSIVDIKEGKIDDINFVKEVFKTKCERFCIGIETGSDVGYSHLQCRVVFKKEWDIRYVIQWFPWAHWSPSHVRDFAYCEKEGNFLRSWEEVLQKYVDIKPVLWQTIALEMWNKQNDRQITVIYDEKGNHGKSWLRKHLIATHQATMIPPMESSRDIMRVAMKKPAKGYVIDLPRAEGKVAIGMWSAVEQLKDGYLWDERYTFEERWIEPPKVMVFCNDLGKRALSTDRFDVLDITDFPVMT